MSERTALAALWKPAGKDGALGFERFTHYVRVETQQRVIRDWLDEFKLDLAECVTQRPQTRCSCGMFDLIWCELL